MGLKDGLESLEIHAVTFSGTTMQAGTMEATTVQGTTMSGTTVQTGNAVIAGSADIPSVFDNTGSPYATGNYLQFTTETVISGGMWVNVSGKAGGASVLASAAVIDSTPLGFALATVGSNTTVNVLTRGLHYAAVEETITNGVTFAMGGGAALNTIKISVSGAAAGIVGTRGTVLAGAASGGNALVYLW